MNEEIKYCKCGFCVKNICKDCNNKKQRDVYKNSKNYHKLEQENQQLKEQLQQKEDIINKAKEYVKDYKTEWTLNDEVLDDMDELLKILDIDKGE